MCSVIETKKTGTVAETELYDRLPWELIAQVALTSITREPKSIATLCQLDSKFFTHCSGDDFLLDAIELRNWTTGSDTFAATRSVRAHWRTMCSLVDQPINFSERYMRLHAKAKTIEEDSFRSCTSLALTELPVGVTTIGLFAFWNCTSLALTELPKGVTHMGACAFRNCESLCNPRWREYLKN